MTFTRKSNLARITVLAGILILIVLYSYTHIHNGQDVLLRTFVSVLPLAIFIPGILARKYRSASFLCFVLLIYFMVASQALFIPGKLWHDVFAMSVVVILFTVSMFYARWQQRADVYEGEASYGE